MHKKTAEHLIKFVEAEAALHEAAAGRTPASDEKVARRTAALLLRSFLSVNIEMMKAMAAEEEADRKKWESERDEPGKPEVTKS